MKIKKLSKIILVAPSYLIVSYNGHNQTVYCDTKGYSKDDMYEMEEDSIPESKPVPIKKERFKFMRDEEQEEKV